MIRIYSANRAFDSVDSPLRWSIEYIFDEKCISFIYCDRTWEPSFHRIYINGIPVGTLCGKYINILGFNESLPEITLTRRNGEKYVGYDNTIGTVVKQSKRMILDSLKCLSEESTMLNYDSHGVFIGYTET